ncbi:MAG: hypothetical protein LBM00_06810 [Deltaproteobacteria bacterium]|jgi:predicted dehydrogenase|nr:hypothetical protein [Deltaproteobacteria bacterium]
MVTIFGAGEVFRSKIRACLTELGVSNFNIYSPKLTPAPKITDFQLHGPVLILSPNAFHLPQIEHVLKKGHPCYVEKPMVISVAELEQLRELAANSCAPLYCGDYYYFKALPLLLRYGRLEQYREYAAQSGEYAHAASPIVSVEAALLEGGGEASGSIEHRAWLGDAKAGGGMLLDLMLHLTNILNMLGLNLETVSMATLGRFDRKTRQFRRLAASSEAEDYAEIRGALTGGIPVAMKAGKYSPRHERFVRLRHADGCVTTLHFTKDNIAETVDKNGKRLWQSKLLADPYLLTMRDAFAFFRDHANMKEKPCACFFEEQALSIRQIDMIKNRALG